MARIVYDIYVVIFRSFALFYRHNMIHCGILVRELPDELIQELFNLKEYIGSNDFDGDLVAAGDWLEYVENR